MSDQKSFTAKLIKQIQDINGNPALSPEEKKAEIAKLQGATKESMYEYLNKNFRTGPSLSKSLSKFVSKDRPRGGPSRQGTKKSLKHRLSSFRT